uniref:Mitochondrial import receptor subunit TOM34 n=1 Tax=Mus spicilegus TaxID=10103 RepID=A0A8C6IAH1_MUSSI
MKCISMPSDIYFPTHDLALPASIWAGSADPEEESVLYSNRAACYLKDGNCTDCIKDCTSALALVPFSIKPLLRRASAYEALEKYTLAYVDYKTVLQIDNSVASALEGINRITRALMDSLGPEWRLKLPPIPVVPVSAQKRWNSLPSENHKETAKTKSKEATATKSRVPSAGDVERAKALKEEGNDLVKKGNHKKAIEKYSESLLCSSLESATYSNRALCHLVLKQYKEAVKDCTEALKLDGKNVKAFYRRAQAYKALKVKIPRTHPGLARAFCGCRLHCSFSQALEKLHDLVSAAVVCLSIHSPPPFLCPLGPLPNSLSLL